MDQICFNGETSSFVQDQSLYLIDKNKEVKKVKLRASKVKGRQCFLAYANLSDGSFLTYSFDFCLSLVKVKESSIDCWKLFGCWKFIAGN